MRHLVVISQQLLPGPRDRQGVPRRTEKERVRKRNGSMGHVGNAAGKTRPGVLVYLAKISLPCRLCWQRQCGGGVRVCIPEQLEEDLPGGPLLLGVTEQDPPLLPWPQTLPFLGVSRCPGAELAAAASHPVREQARRLTRLQTVLVLWAKKLSRG